MSYAIRIDVLIIECNHEMNENSKVCDTENETGENTHDKIKYTYD